MTGDYEFFVDFTAKPDSVKIALKEIEAHCKHVKVISADENDLGSGSVPWFYNGVNVKGFLLQS